MQPEYLAGKLEIKNYGPFREAEIEIKPLTIFIGRNGSGKSLLLYTIWMLASTSPDTEVFVKEVLKKNNETIETILKKIPEGSDISKEYKELLKAYLEVFPKAIESALKEKIREVFGVEPSELIYGDEKEAFISVHGFSGDIELRIILNRSGGISVRYGKEYSKLFDKMLDGLSIQVVNPTSREVLIEHKAIKIKPSEYKIADRRSLHSSLVVAMAYILVFKLAPFFYAEINAPLLVDGRAGIVRTLLKPYIYPLVARNVLATDIQLVNLYYMFAEYLYKGLIDLGGASSLLGELGIKRVIPRFREGIYVIEIETLTGKVVPLEKASSGVREGLLAILSLLAPSELGTLLTFLEEPEAHLHPRAISKFVDFLVRRISEEGVHVLITSHSDHLLYKINNYIIRFRETKEKSRESPGLPPFFVSAYMLRVECENDLCYSVVEKLRVDENGIDESEFTKIAEELADERFKYAE